MTNYHDDHIKKVSSVGGGWLEFANNKKKELLNEYKNEENNPFYEHP